MVRMHFFLLLAVPLASSSATCSNSDETCSTDNILLSVKRSVQKSFADTGPHDASTALGEPASLNLLEGRREKWWPFSGWWGNKDKKKEGKEDDDFKNDDDDAAKEEQRDDDDEEPGSEDQGGIPGQEQTEVDDDNAERSDEEEGGESGGTGDAEPGGGRGGTGDDDDPGGDHPGAASAEVPEDVPAGGGGEEDHGDDGGDSGVWVDAVNEMRAMHGACPLEWAGPLATGIKEWVDALTSLQHADSYHIPPPGGPCGENLAWGSNGITPAVAVDMWYNEVNNCAQLPGCEDPLPGTMTGHFTAMVWKGARTMGCAISENGNYAGCRWKAGDTLSADTPNMAMPGLYEANVGAAGERPTDCS